MGKKRERRIQSLAACSKKKHTPPITAAVVPLLTGAFLSLSIHCGVNDVMPSEEAAESSDGA
jgi:hypothetical protein